MSRYSFPAYLFLANPASEGVSRGGVLADRMPKKILLKKVQRIGNVFLVHNNNFVQSAALYAV